ncbi:hypothetical protein C5C66_02680 [Rathayibacter toxicus]|uniref:Thiamine pyrophosphate enzyme TPP-binding domain-containing protein n=1 Tax=Rathayibacter toxicus TaxID=145458 RepID=A0A2S5Y8S4_9MICO|nr:hypothetical protein C5D15_02655 [Rathayibacter toxicus]PPG47745.1 hypothetical protein C5D16_02650 [Rathayibacter toxicus]PPH24888.1 hypothetical protein C5D17_02635 [Rathayibacter toxicus]PPH58813.1 hypothetical protein C5D30_02650 [Rathayibacter toxicus]PPH60808.1 hypothetical protein C5C93_02685 [Rathayibacter toxicus]
MRRSDEKGPRSFLFRGRASLLTRSELLHAISPAIARSTVVAALGNTSRQIFAEFDHERCFYLLGSMGMPTSVGLGLSVGADHDVLVIEGDGGLLMNLGGVATAARYGRNNLKIVVVDNEAYESTGAQPSHSGKGANLATIAHGCGISRVVEVTTPDDAFALDAWLREPGVSLAVAKVANASDTPPRVQLTPPEIFHRVQNSLLKAEK